MVSHVDIPHLTSFSFQIAQPRLDLLRTAWSDLAPRSERDRVETIRERVAQFFSPLQAGTRGIDIYFHHDSREDEDDAEMHPLSTSVLYLRAVPIDPTVPNGATRMEGAPKSVNKDPVLRPTARFVKPWNPQELLLIGRASHMKDAGMSSYMTIPLLMPFNMSSTIYPPPSHTHTHTHPQWV